VSDAIITESEGRQGEIVVTTEIPKEEQNDKYEFTIEDSAFGGSYEDDVMEYGDSEDEWYID